MLSELALRNGSEEDAMLAKGGQRGQGPVKAGKADPGDIGTPRG